MGRTEGNNAVFDQVQLLDAEDVGEGHRWEETDGGRGEGAFGPNGHADEVCGGVFRDGDGVGDPVFHRGVGVDGDRAGVVRHRGVGEFGLLRGAPGKEQSGDVFHV